MSHMASKAAKTKAKENPEIQSAPEAATPVEAKDTPKAKAAPKAKAPTKPKAAPKAEATSKPKASKGKRYSDAEKAEILKFVEAFNAKSGRGGQTAAAQKYGVTQLTLASWLKASGGSTKQRKSGSKLSGSSLSFKLASLAKLHAEITRAEKELQTLKAKFSALRTSL